MYRLLKIAAQDPFLDAECLPALSGVFVDKGTKILGIDAAFVIDEFIPLAMK